MRISDWSSDVCSSDLPASISPQDPQGVFSGGVLVHRVAAPGVLDRPVIPGQFSADAVLNFTTTANPPGCAWAARSAEHTSELQSLMRISYAVFCLKKKKK